MVKVKCGAIIKDVPEGSLKWYKIAGWVVLPDQDKKTSKKAKAQKEPKTEDLEEVKDETNTKENVTS
jgi:hypothetical protein